MYEFPGIRLLEKALILGTDDQPMLAALHSQLGQCVGIGVHGTSDNFRKCLFRLTRLQAGKILPYERHEYVEVNACLIYNRS